MEDLFKTYGSEVAIATDAYFTLKHINKKAAKDAAIYSSLDSDARIWNIVTHSLQCTYFMALGRIFDINGETFSIHKLINKCIENVELFSKKNLRKRKHSGDGEEPEWLKQYLVEAYEPTVKDFQKLKSHVAKYRKTYDEKIRPVRHDFFGHKNYALLHDSHEIFRNIQLSDVEDILNFLHQVDKFLFNLWANGMLSELDNYKIDEEPSIECDVCSILNKIRA